MDTQTDRKRPRRPMRRAFIGNFLDDGYRPKRKLKTNADVARYLLQASLADWGGKPVTGPNPASDARIARTMAMEVIAAVEREGGKVAANWYTEAIGRAVKVASAMHPELADDAKAIEIGKGIASAEDARCVFFAALAITSQNVTIHENVRYALEQYRHYVKEGSFLPKGYGTKGSSIEGNLRRFNFMVEAFEGVAGVRDFLAREFRMGDLAKVAEGVGIKLALREGLNEMVYGSMVFGPKIGNGFYQNLIGNHRPVTIDMWFMRTFGRYTGTLVKDIVTPAQVDRLVNALRSRDADMIAKMVENDVAVSHEDIVAMEATDLGELVQAMMLCWERMRRELQAGGMSNPDISAYKSRIGWPGAADSIVKSLVAPVDQPERRSDRKWIRSVVGKAQDLLAKDGYHVSAADIQALLWYPEKDLYDFLSSRPLGYLNVSYDEALIVLARQEGFTDDRIEAAIGTLGRGAGGPGVHPGAGPGEPAAVQVVREGAGGPAAPGEGQASGRSPSGRAGFLSRRPRRVLAVATEDSEDAPLPGSFR